jgi:hypothetical protein
MVYLTIIYAAVALGATWLSGHFVTPNNDATTFFTAGGAMIGAAVAIILTFNTLIINFASIEYPPEFYKATGYDWRQNVIYFLLVADATALFVFSLIFKQADGTLQTWLFPLAILVICEAFYLLFASYVVTRKRLDPKEGLSTIRKIAIQHLEKGAKSGDKLAKVFATNPQLKPEDRGLARKEAYSIMAPQLEQVSTINGYLHDYHDKLIAKQNYATATKVLDTIYAVLVKYIEIRRDNMQARMSSYFLAFTTDSQDFFERNLQQFVDKSKRYMDSKNTTGVIHITDLVCNLAQHASTVEFGVRTENPLLDQVQGYLNSITEEAIAKNDTEAMFHLADVYSVLGRQAVIKNLRISKNSAYEQLVKIGQKGAVTGQSSIMGRVADAFNSILVEIHNRGDVRQDMEPRNLFDEYQKVLMLYIVSPIASRSSSLTNPQMVAPYNTTFQWMAELSRLPADEVDRRVHNQFTELSESIRRSMRKMSETISLGDHNISIEFGTTLQSSANLMLGLRLKPEWQDIDNELISQAKWHVHQLSWLKEKTAKASDYITRELVENAGYIGLQALETNTPDIAKASIEVIANLSNYYLEKAEKDNGYDPARFMQTACLIGIYAKNLNMEEVYELAKAKASEFNTAYNRKHFPDGPLETPNGRDYIGLHPDVLLRELNELYEESSPEFGVMPDSFPTFEDEIGQHVSRDDVHSFTAEITPPPTLTPPEPPVTSVVLPTIKTETIVENNSKTASKANETKGQNDEKTS